jgi:thioredoxin
MAVPVVSEQQFEQEVLSSELPVLVDFYADWCQPCKVVAPEVEAAATELEGKAKVVKVDIDKSPRLAQALRIQGVPTFAVFHQGRPVALKSSVLKKKQLVQMVEPFLPRAEGAVKAPELAELIKEGQVVAVDTREASSFGRAHIPGAQSFPLEEIRTRLAELQLLAGAPILYCRTGKDSKELSEDLAKDGIQTGFLEGGFLAWESELLPVERPD